MDQTSQAIRSIQRHVARIVAVLDETDYYTLLELPLDATPQQLRQSYRAIVGAYRFVLEHESCPRSLGDDIWTVCQRLALAVRTLCDKASRDVHVATFKPVPRSADAPPYHPVRLRPDQPSAILITAESDSDATAEITEEPTRPYACAGDGPNDAWRSDTEVGTDLPSLKGGGEPGPPWSQTAIDQGAALEAVATIADPRLPLAVTMDQLGSADTALAEPIDEEATAVDQAIRVGDADPVLESPPDTPDDEEPLRPFATEVEDPTNQDREAPFEVKKGPSRE